MTAHHAPAKFAHDGSQMIRCHCCRDHLHPADFRPDYWSEYDATRCEAAHKGPVCVSCMDEWLSNNNADGAPVDWADVPSIQNMGRMV